MNKQKELAEKYMKSNQVNTVHGTSDGFLFTRPQDALAHAVTLENKDVETFGKVIVEEIPVVDAKTISGNQIDPLSKDNKDAIKSLKPGDAILQAEEGATLENADEATVIKVDAPEAPAKPEPETVEHVERVPADQAPVVAKKETTKKKKATTKK